MQHDDHRTRPAVSRRAVLKGAAGAAAGASALSTAIAQASTGNPGFFVNLRQDKGEVVIYNYYQPWIAKVIPLFEEETGIKVNQLGTYAGNDEWWARLNAGESFDFVIAAFEWLERAMKADLLHPLDLEQIPNTKNLYADFQDNPDFAKDGTPYGSPFARVYYCLTYNTNTFSETPTSWDVAWDEAYKGKVTMMDDAFGSIGTAALRLGQDPLNPSDFDAIRDALTDQKDLVLKYWLDYQNGMEMFINEEVVVGQFTAGRTRMGRAEGGPISWTVPEEGCLTFFDTFAIPKTAKNPENGHAFINFLQKPEIMAMEMEMMYYDTVNEAAREELPADLREQFELPEGANLVLARDLDPQVRSTMDETWTEIKLS
jgi:spermidine/putrescine transport system substrate-binding protein